MILIFEKVQIKILNVVICGKLNVYTLWETNLFLFWLYSDFYFPTGIISLSNMGIDLHKHTGFRLSRDVNMQSPG